MYIGFADDTTVTVEAPEDLQKVMAILSKMFQGYHLKFGSNER